MTKKEKRLKRIQQNPKSVSSEALQQVLIDYGFILLRSSGSHHFFECVVEERVWQLTIPFKKPHVKVTYVKKALTAIEEIAALQVSEESENNYDDN